MACRKGYLNIVKYLSSLKNININAASDGFTPVSWLSWIYSLKFSAACYMGRLDVVKYLSLLDVVNVNAANKNNATPVNCLTLISHWVLGCLFPWSFRCCEVSHFFGACGCERCTWIWFHSCKLSELNSHWVLCGLSKGAFRYCEVSIFFAECQY